MDNETLEHLLEIKYNLQLQTRDKLIKKLKEYAAFVSEYGMGQYASFLYVHHITTPQEIIDKGIELRKEIEELEEELSGSIN